MSLSIARLFGFFLMVRFWSGLLCGALGSASVAADKRELSSTHGGLQNLASKNTERSVKFELRTNNG